MQTEKQPEAVELVELLLTAEIYNRVHKLTEADLPPDIRRHYSDPETEDVRRPILVSGADAEKICGLQISNRCRLICLSWKSTHLPA